MGDTESGHCQGACHSQWFFYVPLQVSETASPFTYMAMRAMRDAQSPMLKGEKHISAGLSCAHRGLNPVPLRDRRARYHLRYCTPPIIYEQKHMVKQLAQSVLTSQQAHHVSNHSVCLACIM